MQYLIVPLFFLASFFQVPEVNGWAFRQVSCLVVLSLFIAWRLSKKFHISVGLCFFATSIYGLVQWGVPQFGSEVVSSLMVMYLFSCLALECELNFILPLLAFVAIGDSIIMIVRFLANLGDPWVFMKAWWVITNASLDACFVALMFPIIWTITKRKKWLQITTGLIVCASVILAKSNTALIVLLISSFPIFSYKLFFLSPLSYFFLGNKFAQDLGRYHNWERMFTFWNDNINHFIGSGPGTYWVISQLLQAHKIGDAVFAWMHNDWLQVLFEQGYIGLGCVFFLYFSMLYKSFKRPILLSMIIGYGVIALTLYPLHLFMFQLLGVALIYLCFTVKNKEQFNPLVL